MDDRQAEQLGRDAFASGRPAAAALDPTIMAEVADAAVGEKTHLLAAFSRGWNAANAES
ncbi:hypothetical protein [Mycolicibacterium conceptionense]|uniref:hypothetical protein n=1 Tax=Mycolicibacterium conceptionense TaxID=451644 RepID=UPI0013F5BB82|nr:hypothetical protein [Mycolicibacterium conceptionense]